MNIFLSILFILTLISTSFAQEKTEKYIIQFSEHVFVDNLSKSYVYSIHDLMPGKRNDLRSLVELSEQSRLLFHKMIPEAIAG